MPIFQLLTKQNLPEQFSRSAKWLPSLLLGVNLCFFASLANSDELALELHKIDALRQKGPAPIEQVEELGNELLARYKEPQAQGRIYYQLAFTLAQSGITKNQDHLERYCQKALELNKTPLERARMFCFYGDLLSVRKTLPDFPTQRREAAAVYLRGLKELIDLQLPEGPGELPPVDKIGDLGLGPNDPETLKQLEQNQAQQKTREEAKFFNEAAMHRKVLAGQLVYLYSRPPYNLKEFQTSAQKLLEDPKQVEQISQAIETQFAKMKDIYKAPQKAKPPAAPNK
jgi:hypothetical protein